MSLRVKLIFEQPLVNTPEQCWMLVERKSCKKVRDLEYTIVKKFFVSNNTILNLYLDEFLIPSQEKIDVIRDNDVIKVVEEKLLSVNDVTKKRKFDSSEPIDSRQQIKKAKKSFEKPTSEKVSNGGENHSKVIKTSMNGALTKMPRNTSDNMALSPINSVTKRANETGKIKKKGTKRKKGSNKTIVQKVNGFWKNLAMNRSQENVVINDKNGCQITNLPEIPGNVVKGKSYEDRNGSKEDISSHDKTCKVKPHINKVMQINVRHEGNHIRFDNNDDEDDEYISGHNPLKNAVLTHPRVLSIREAETPVCNRPNISVIESSQNGCDSSAKNQKGKRRKDSYVNKSIVLESTRVREDHQADTSVESKHRDFTIYPLLHGPPRVGDCVAYKIIELSQSYTPEMSRYKEGKVLSYDAISCQLKLKLTSESLERVKGDGHVSNKFELFEYNDEDLNNLTETQSNSDEIEIQWTSMIEPRLVGSAPLTVG